MLLFHHERENSTICEHCFCCFGNILDIDDRLRKGEEYGQQIAYPEESFRVTGPMKL